MTPQQLKEFLDHMGWSGAQFGRYLGKTDDTICAWRKKGVPKNSVNLVTLACLALKHGYRVEDMK